jgi:hypothetical protein
VARLDMAYLERWCQILGLTELLVEAAGTSQP